jgi:hypothetical protein
MVGVVIFLYAKVLPANWMPQLPPAPATVTAPAPAAPAAPATLPAPAPAK